MSASSGSPSHHPRATVAFKDHVRRHCEQLLAGNTATSSPHANRPSPGRHQLHEHGASPTFNDELRRFSDGQLRPVHAGNDPFVGPPPVMIPQHVTMSGTHHRSGANPAFSEVRRSSDGQLQRPMFAGDREQPFTGPPPMTIPQHMSGNTHHHKLSDVKPEFNELRRSSDGQLKPRFTAKDPFAGPVPVPPPAMLIPQHILDEQSANAEVQLSQKEFRVDVDVAAYTPEELDVKIVGDHVVIRGKHAEERPGEQANISRQFSRRYTLPDDVIVEEVSVFLAKDGMMSVKVPRKTAAVEERHPMERKTKVKFLDEKH